MSSRFLIAAAIIAIAIAPDGARADHAVVLVTSRDSTIRAISPLEIRKLYLGFRVTDENNRLIHATRLNGDGRLWEIFLQDVMGMSAKSYDRRLLTLTLQSGRPRPAVHESVESLIEYLKDNPNAVAFAWEEEVADRADLKVLRVLWHR